MEVFDIDAISGDIALKIGSPSDTRQDPPPRANGGGGVQLPPSAVSAVPLFLKKKKIIFFKKGKKKSLLQNELQQIISGQIKMYGGGVSLLSAPSSKG